MSDENVPENQPAGAEPPKPPVSIRKMLQESIDDAKRVLENTETVTNTNRQIVNGGLIGTCLVFLAAMLSLQQKQIDTPLTVAFISFSVALPMLVYGFLWSTHKTKPVRGYLVLEAMILGAWVIEGFGWIPVGVGVLAVILHLNPLAFLVCIIVILLVVVLGFSGSFVGLIIYAWTKYKPTIKKQNEATPPASGDTPPQEQQTP